MSDIFIPQDPCYQKAFDIALKALRAKLTLLIQGQTGTGKDVLVRYIHQTLMPDAPLISVNCGAIHDSLAESELFGHEKGTFTGAETLRVGKIEAAHNGILFLDEIGNMPLETQAKLLRALENKKITRLGSNQDITVCFHLIAATNVDLEAAVQQGLFRADLYYRIKQLVIHMPTLKNCRESIPQFLDYFVEQFNQKYQTHFDPDHTMIADYMQRDWPGNVRELKNEMQKLVALYSQDIPYSTLQSAYDTVQPQRLNHRLDTVEKTEIISALHRQQHNVAAAARILGVPRSTLQGKMKKYQIVG